MSEAVQKRRILVGVDLSAGSRAAAELTIEIASALDAEVRGLFVEDDQLLMLAAHPLVRELDTWSATERQIDTARLERAMRAQGSRARDLLARMTARRGIPCSFQTIRGPATATIREASRSVDVVTLGRAGWSPGDKRRLGGTVRELLIGGECALLIPGAHTPTGGPVVFCCDRTDAHEHTLAVAAELADRMNARLAIEILGDTPPSVAVRARLATIVAEAAPNLVPPTVETIPAVDLDRTLHGRPARLVVLGRGGSVDDQTTTRLATELDSPLLVISAAPSAGRPLPRR